MQSKPRSGGMMAGNVKDQGLVGEEVQFLGDAIRSLPLWGREENRKALLDGKRNGVCPHFSVGCRVVFLAHEDTQVLRGCSIKPCPFDPPTL